MTAPLRVTTQAALDTALAEGVTDLIVDGLLAFADLCEQQLAAWSEVES